MKKTKKRDEVGFALVVALLLLMILSALALTITFTTDSDTLVNGNNRQVELADFAAKAGMEAARDLMSRNNVNSIFATVMGADGTPPGPPLSVPSSSNNSVIYILNEGDKPGSVQPWNADNAYFDDELCHDGYNLGWSASAPSPGVRCTEAAGGSGWYKTIPLTSTNSGGIPFSGTSAALPFRWARIARKLNGSIQNYTVDPTQPASAQVCWNGVSEVVLPITYHYCNEMLNTAEPVFIITSLAVANPNNPSQSARAMVQAEVVVTSSQSFPYGMFAAGTSCPAITLSGGATTDSFNSAEGSYADTNCITKGTCSLAGGNLGTNGGASLSGGNTAVYGSIATAGNCTPAVSINGGASDLGEKTISPYVPVIPPAPNPAPPTTKNNYTKDKDLPPGTYGNINVNSATLTLTPGIYNINSISLGGNSKILIVPSGQVVLNVMGTGQNTPVDLSGGSLSNDTHIATNFIVNYAGTGTVKVTGGSGTYMVVNTPKADVNITGGSDFYGAIMGRTISESGGTMFHFDIAAYQTPESTANYFSIVSMRQLMY